MPSSELRVSVVVPFHRDLDQLAECLYALHPLPDWAELVVVADGAVESCRHLVSLHGGRVIDVEGPRGPAVARNRGAAAATGDVLVFIDSDVVAAPGVIAKFREVLTRRPDVAAVFGAYDEHPRDTRFMSQYKNLAHSYFHQSSNREARTFWAGLGAVRRKPFNAVGGFDERFSRPTVEDIELGYRLSSRGQKVLLEPSIRACHLKRWTLISAVMSDLRDRGIPWTQLVLKFDRLDNDLNLQRKQRMAVVLSYAMVLALALSLAMPMWLGLAAGLSLALAALNWHYYTFFLRRRGVWFGVRVFPIHVLHHLCNGVSFVTGCALYYATSRAGVALRGAVPLTRWGYALRRISMAG